MSSDERSTDREESRRESRDRRDRDSNSRTRSSHRVSSSGGGGGGRNIFDPNVNPKYMKGRNKMHPYPPQPLPPPPMSHHHHHPHHPPPPPYGHPHPYYKPHYMGGGPRHPMAPPQHGPPPPYMYAKRQLPPGAMQDEKQQQYLAKNAKVPNYRLVGRNIFDPSMNQPAFNMKQQPTAKTNKYYDRFIKQHPMSHLPLVFQKSVSLAEDKALEVKEKHKQKKKKKKGGNGGEQSSGSSDSDDSNSDSEDGKIYSDISSNSEPGSGKKKSRRKKNNNKKKKKKSAKNKGSDQSSGSSSGSSDSDADRQYSYRNDNGDMSGADSDGSMVNLRENLKPIGAYIRNRDQMFEEMVRSIRGLKLQAMLPDVLKNIRFDFIRQKCMEELDIMSKKRILCILQDKPMLSSSGTEESSDEVADEAADDGKKVKQENQPPIKTQTEAKPSFVPKFKPIVNDNSDEMGFDRANYNVEQATTVGGGGGGDGENDNSVELGNIDITAPTATTSGDGQKPTQSGVAAAGFKNFIKKSISIRIKAADGAVVKAGVPVAKQAVNGSGDYNRMEQHMMGRDGHTQNRSHNNQNYINAATENDYYQSYGHVSYTNTDNNGYYNETEGDGRHMESYDYNYDLDDELYNLNNLIATNATNDDDLLNSGHGSDTSYSSSSSIVLEFAKKSQKKKSKSKKKEILDYLSDSASSVSIGSVNSVVDDDDDDLVKHKKNKLKTKRKTKESKTAKSGGGRKEKTSKKRATKRDSESDGAQNDGSESVSEAREALKCKLEACIEHMTNTDGDNELKEILENLLRQIVDNDSLTIDECEDINQTFNHLYEQMMSQHEDIGNEEDEAEEEEQQQEEEDNVEPAETVVKKKSSSKSDKIRKRKMKSKSSEASLKRKRARHHKRKHSESNEDDDDEEEEDGELEAGEIDDIYDDEFVIEKELQNLLQENC